MNKSKNEFGGRQFTADVILWAVRWYLQFPISYRDLERMLADHGVSVDHATVCRWTQCYAPEIDKRTRHHLQMAVVQTFATDATKRSGTLRGSCGENFIPNCGRSFAIDAELSEFELTFPDPMHEFNAGDGDRGAPKALQSKHWTQTKFDRSMVLLYQII